MNHLVFYCKHRFITENKFLFYDYKFNNIALAIIDHIKNQVVKISCMINGLKIFRWLSK